MAVEVNRYRKGLLFVNKKKKKHFVNLGIMCTGLPRVSSDPFKKTVFASFFQKRCFSPSLQSIDFSYYDLELTPNVPLEYTEL